MAWVKLDDAMPHHPKVMAAGPQAFALDVAGICYSNRFDLDGLILDHYLNAICPSLRNPSRWAQVLVDVGRWTRVEGGWRIHDIDKYQPTAQQQKEISKKRAEAGRKGGQSKRKQTDSKPKASSKQVASTDNNPVPSRPDDEASSSFASFQADRAAEVVRKRKRDGLPVKSDGGLARYLINEDEDFKRETRRLWAHRDCSECKGEGFIGEYSPGAGMRQVECSAVVGGSS